MLKKSIKYTDYNGVERVEDFWFNISKAELMDMHLGTSGGLDQAVDRIRNVQDVPSLAKFFKEFILVAYGEKSDDGKRFIKSQEMRDAFSQTDAYSELYMELINNIEAWEQFFVGVVPAKLAKEIETKLPSTNAE